MKILSCPSSAKAYFLLQKYYELKQQICYIAVSDDNAQKIADNLSIFAKGLKVLYIPSTDALPYDRTASSILHNCNRMRALLQAQDADIIISPAANLVAKLPDYKHFSATKLHISLGQELNIKALTNQLMEIGFTRSNLANDEGEFAIRGEIIDVASHENVGYRICGAFGNVDSIKIFDLDTQLSSEKQSEVTIYPAGEIIYNDETLELFRKKYILSFGVNSPQIDVMEEVEAGRRPSFIEQLAPLFYEQCSNLTDYLPNAHSMIIDNLYEQSIAEIWNTIEDYYSMRLEGNKDKLLEFYPAINPDNKYFSSQEIQEYLGKDAYLLQSSSDHPDIKSIPNFYLLAQKEKRDAISLLQEYAIENRQHKIILISENKTGMQRLQLLLEQQDISFRVVPDIETSKKNILNLLQAPMQSGFKTKDYVFISQHDLFGSKVSGVPKAKAQKQLKNLLAELDSFRVGETVVHKKHGVALFDGIETVRVGDHKHDCIKLIFAGDDKLFIPVENVEQITKYGENDVNLDKLGGVSWQKRHSKLKERIGEMAKKLMLIAANREIRGANDAEFDLKLYDQFCEDFPYVETEDQLTSADAIKEDLTSGKLLDRLICGDVGFGKTEVAMRAAFMVSAAQKHHQQTVIVSPTTILARQHYLSFIERYKNTNIRIAQISRLVPPAQVRNIKEQVALGQIDILIGTHAVLSKDVHFDNLGLVVIDEEQRFGVAQKEKLKELKKDVHVLTMSATPIPRSLQMSLVGIRDLSLITTPPVDRLPVRTNVVIYDPVTVREALMREHFRGGQSFFVCPRIAELEGIESEFKELVPELSYRVAHGRMSPQLLDEIMSDFDEGKFDILLSTTIIESGIDVPRANTMIIYSSDMLGLSQLYQLRGRVGRGKVRGQALLTLKNKHASDKSRKRLEILQNLDGLGAGFTIASHDMDLRGFGNIVGEEQSGHIKEVGVELYHDMLEEAINGIKCAGGEALDDEFTPDLNLGVNVLIPSEYIEDSDLRLAFYRKLAAVKHQEELAVIRSEMADRFGMVPDEVANLTQIISLKLICKRLLIEQVDVGPQALAFKFHKVDEKHEKAIMNIIRKYPRLTKLKPDGRLVILHEKKDINVIYELNQWLERFETALSA